jgi:hypothetical protein
MYQYLIVLLCDLLNIPEVLLKIILEYAELGNVLVMYKRGRKVTANKTFRWNVAVDKTCRHFIPGITFESLKLFMADTCCKFTRKAFVLSQICGDGYTISYEGSPALKTESQVAYALHVICNLRQNGECTFKIRDMKAAKVLSKLLRLFSRKQIYYNDDKWGNRYYAYTKFYIKRIS